jgi:TorA maturation chaperone TorD
VAALDTVSIPEWAQEHERVFGHSVQSTAPPYELEYGEEHSHRQPQELGDIAAFYQAFGLRASSASHERVDHIVTECEFMQYVLYKQACALDEGSQERADVCEAAARQFLADHLGCWGPAFCLRLSRAAEQGILGAVTEAALAWLVQDCARVGVPAGSRDLPLRLPKERDEVGCAACAPQPGRADGPTTCR